MTGQMTIWDFLHPSETLEDIPEEEMVRRVGDAIGVRFAYNDFFGDYRVKVGKWTLSIEYSHYSFGDGALFIGTSIDSTTGGCSSPRDSIDEAVEFFLRNKERTYGRREKK